MTERPLLSRRGLIQAAAVASAAAIPVLAVGSPANAAYRGIVTRDEVMNRARNWFLRDIPYDGGSRASDIEGDHTYRQDCSGFVSMAWHTSTPGHSTRSIPDIAAQIAWSELKPGDVLNAYNDHCMLYHMRGDNGNIWIYDLATPASDMRHIQVSPASLREQDYIPRRYRNIRDN
ncbi:twin-arginine translocation signal domain-containing protein [Glycomyces sp. NPDC049804]|uniref:twin-arginine translocation signal domain-containing protein n=1 Tax=Glycomyces sp. NPDC049804 TaxID=3154363 RepID=UPI0034125F2A